MIKVGFIGAVSKEWMGGLNYFKNLLFALDTLETKELDLYVFVGKNTDIEIKNMFKQYATLIEDTLFDTKSFKWYLMKIEQKIFQTNHLLSYCLKQHSIEVLSHTYLNNIEGIKTISWIPDFQHLHLPQMFSDTQIKNINESFMETIKRSDAVILSSNDALKDYKNFAPDYEKKANVLQFVSQPDKKYFELNENDKVVLFDKYNLPQEFYYMPNQFWKHKNHMLVFEAIKDLKDEGLEICLVCTGHLLDYRNRSHIDEIQKFVKETELEKHIRLLGLVDYADVFGLIKFSKAVINPSLFEGWSSTVEECKSVGKNMILSDLDVHKEQYPEATFFKQKDKDDLKNVFRRYDFTNESKEFKNDLVKRTEKFALEYQNIVIEVAHG
jgi:glycosyltransferase involved in cell wall biosynthesis